MIEMNLGQLNNLFNGKSTKNMDACFSGVEIDSRKDCKNKLFIAINGDNFDGHEFVDVAYSQGASIALVERELDSKIPQVVVEDSKRAMGDLAKYWRKEVNPTLIAITGSNGKTTVKEMLGKILSLQAKTVITQGNFNNEIGVPLSIFNLTRNDCYAVIEMGANHESEIKELVEIAEPDIVFVNNAREAHVEGFGSLQGVIHAKGEMYQYSGKTATSVFNLDEEAVHYWQSVSNSDRCLTFSLSSNADIKGSFDNTNDGMKLNAEYKKEICSCEINVFGVHNASNALAAITLSLACGIGLSKAMQGLNGFAGVKGRLQFVDGLNQSKIIDDSYNANPDSLEAALDVTCSLPGVAWLALGDMAELGELSEEMHKSAVIKAKEKGISECFAIGEYSCRSVSVFGSKGYCFKAHAEMADLLSKRLAPEINLLIKGSRSARMDKLVSALTRKPLADDARGVSNAI